MSFRSLSFRVAFIGSFVVAMMIGLGTVWLLSSVSTVVQGQTSELEQKTVANEASMVRERLNMAATGAKDLASTFEMLRANGVKDRTVYDAVLRASAEHNPEFLGTWAGWEPNVLDGRDTEFAGKPGSDQTGRFLAYWNRTSGEVKRDVLSGYETDAYYVSPQKFNRTVLIEPYFYPVAGRSDLIMSIGVPLKLNGKMAGTIGVDVDLTALYASLGAVKPFGTGYLIVVSAGGQTVVHPKADAVGKQLAEADKPAAEAASRAISSQMTTRVDAIGPDGQMWRYVAEPISSGETKEVWAAVSAIPISTLEAATASVRTTMIVISLVSVAVIGILLFVLLRILMGRPLRAVGRTLDAMAAGDYDRDVREARRRDEIGVIGRAVERFREGLKEQAAEAARREAAQQAEREVERHQIMLRLAEQFESDVGGVVELVSAEAAKLQRTATGLSSLVNNATTQSDFVNSAARAASINVATVANSADHLGASVKDIGAQVAQSSAMSLEAVNEANASAAVIDELSQAANHIGDIVKLISAIAHQTNLLALNATIEASRAGEAGRGFAVVAAEVKDLSHQTASATAAISQQIHAIQGASERAVAAIGAIGRRIHSINETAGSVAAMIDEQGAATLEIVTAVREVSAGTNDVTSSITLVAQTARDTGGAADKVLDAASDLSRQSDHLRNVVNTFLASVRAA